jgi:putative endonuclease
VKNYFVYILASKKNGTLYIGVTNDLNRRIYEHKNNLVEGFTKKYNVKTLVYYESTNSIESAINREKQFKKWNRKWKLKLIEEKNPTWEDIEYSFIELDSRLRGNDRKKVFSITKSRTSRIFITTKLFPKI